MLPKEVDDCNDCNDDDDDDGSDEDINSDYDDKNISDEKYGR